MVDQVGRATAEDRAKMRLPLTDKLLSEYHRFKQESARLFPKVDPKLLANIMYFQTNYTDWEGGVVLRIVYPANKDMNAKKEWLYSKYQRMAQIEEDKTLRFKGVRIYLEDIERLLTEDPEIEYITGSASLAPSDSYSA